MTKKTHIDRSGNEWSWDETPDVVKAVKELAKFSGNYPGPLYAPHPLVKKDGKEIS